MSVPVTPAKISINYILRRTNPPISNKHNQTMMNPPFASADTPSTSKTSTWNEQIRTNITEPRFVFSQMQNHNKKQPMAMAHGSEKQMMQHVVYDATGPSPPSEHTFC